MQHTLSWHTDSFVLVEQWTTSSLLGLLTAMLVSIALGGLYEWLRRYLTSWDNKDHVICSGQWCEVLTLRSLRSALHAFSATVSYILMLFLMTYNVWVLISTLLGSAIGFYFLGPNILPEVRGNEERHANNTAANGKYKVVHQSRPEFASPPQIADSELTEATPRNIDTSVCCMGEDKGSDSAFIPKTSSQERVTALVPRYVNGAPAEERLDLLIKDSSGDVG